MAFKLGDDNMDAMNEMNLIPLIDIMLVLMIIFLVTATVFNPTVPLQLPNTSAQVNNAPPEPIQISIDKDAGIYWDKELISIDELQARLTDTAHSIPPDVRKPTIRLRADKDGKYDTVAQVLAVANTAGLTNIAFVTE